MHGLALLHRGPENVTLFHVTVVSTNIDQFLEYFPNSRPYTELITTQHFFDLPASTTYCCCTTL